MRISQTDWTKLNLRGHGAYYLPNSILTSSRTLACPSKLEPKLFLSCWRISWKLDSLELMEPKMLTILICEEHVWELHLPICGNWSNFSELLKAMLAYCEFDLAMLTLQPGLLNSKFVTLFLKLNSLSQSGSKVPIHKMIVVNNKWAKQKMISTKFLSIRNVRPIIQAVSDCEQGITVRGQVKGSLHAQATVLEKQCFINVVWRANVLHQIWLSMPIYFEIKNSKIPELDGVWLWSR